MRHPSVELIHYLLGYALILFSLIPLIRNDNWIFRVFEYPRAQKLFINLVLLASFCVTTHVTVTHQLIFVSALSLNLIYLSYQVWPYTFIATKQMKKSTEAAGSRRFKLFIANVYQDNLDTTSCIDAIRKNSPDLVLLVETDTNWKKQLDAALKSAYKYVAGSPLNNTYGMLLYSKFELIDARVKFLVEPDVPSIHTRVKLPNGHTFRLYGLHPQPPVPQENPRSSERDGEILSVAKEVKGSSEPVIVAGDMNDVAWSYTTELFLKVSKLLDPRRGRGFFNTFNAHYLFLRWPLDHVFCSVHFHLVHLERLPSIGSDHFPILIELDLIEEKATANQKEKLDSDAEDEKTANRKIRKVKQS
ncbi:MAG TPA: endonuclease/exonuclease/phosphatase family protein [Chryseosolibacter sp.]|nr:endonuclease/exonuclease/phosphatase family protein [Chryseosolibacter sp.]